ncbi:Hsp70 protein-domain-containing protein [Neocallimastix lanati (nom. inval.)]|nr:Hsp70 protein-domain-containing protein [Neocallimastix sp. JGI-2020a]
MLSNLKTSNEIQDESDKMHQNLVKNFSLQELILNYLYTTSFFILKNKEKTTYEILLEEIKILVTIYISIPFINPKCINNIYDKIKEFIFRKTDFLILALQEEELLSYNDYERRNGRVLKKKKRRFERTDEIYVLIKCQEITDVVITVPIHFNKKKADILAGLNVLRIINKPNAGIMAYSIHKEENESSKIVLVFDLGDGTFDISILIINKGLFEELAISGDNHLGGIEFDNRLACYLLKEFGSMYRIEIKINNIMNEVNEQVKELLSDKNEVNIIIDFLYEGKDLKIKIIRSEFEELNEDLFKRIIKLMEKALKDANLEKDIIVENIIAVASGIKTAYGNVELIIKCNTTIPAQGIKAVICCSQEVKNFTTSCDQQTTALIPIYEGERLFTKHNNLLSKFYLSNNPQVPKGELKISIIMDVDDNGILNV